MQRIMLKSKIHRATVTQSELDYEGSVTIDKNLLEAANILEHEQVNIWNLSSGTRLTTYAMEGERDTGIICVNGAGAHLNKPGDLVIISSFVNVDENELEGFKSIVVLVDEKNKVKRIKT